MTCSCCYTFSIPNWEDLQVFYVEISVSDHEPREEQGPREDIPTTKYYVRVKGKIDWSACGYTTSIP